MEVKAGIHHIFVLGYESAFVRTRALGIREKKK